MKNFRKLHSFVQENEFVPRPFFKTLIKQQKMKALSWKHVHPSFCLWPSIREEKTFFGILWNSVR
jgi:hypothetical protein